MIEKILRFTLLLSILWIGLFTAKSPIHQICDVQGLTPERIIAQAKQIEYKERIMKKKRLFMITGAMTILGVAAFSFLNNHSEKFSANDRARYEHHYPWFLYRSDLSFKEEVFRGIRNGCTFGFYSAVGGIAYCLAQEGYGALAQNIKECFFDYRDEQLLFLNSAFNNRCAFFRNKITSCLKHNNDKEIVVDSACSLIFACDECLLNLVQLIAFYQYYTMENSSDWGEYDSLLYTHQVDTFARQLQSDASNLAELCYQGEVSTEAYKTGWECLKKLQGIQEFVVQKVREYRRDVHGIQNF